MSYLRDAIRKNAGGPSTTEQLAEVEKRGRGNTSYASHLREELAVEKAAEQVNLDRIKELESQLNADALEAEKLRKECVLSLPETNPEEIRLNGYAQKVTEIAGANQYTEEDWKNLFLTALPEAQLRLQGQNVAPLNGTEIEMVARYMVANQLYLGDAEGILRAFKALRNHAVIRVPLPIAAPAPAAAAPAGRFALHDKVLADLERQLAELPIGNSRERERLERLHHKEQVTRELLAADSVREVLGEIATQSGLVIPSTLALQFANFLGSPIAKGRFGKDKTSVRLAFAEFTGQGDTFLTDDEKSLVGTYRAVENMSADDIVKQVGMRRDYGTRVHGGIRQPVGSQ